MHDQMLGSCQVPKNQKYQWPLAKLCVFSFTCICVEAVVFQWSMSLLRQHLKPVSVVRICQHQMNHMVWYRINAWFVNKLSCMFSTYLLKFCVGNDVQQSFFNVLPQYSRPTFKKKVMKNFGAGKDFLLFIIVFFRHNLYTMFSPNVRSSQIFN